MKVINRDEKQRFSEEGYIIIPAMYSREEIRELSDWIRDLSKHTPKPGEEMFYSDPSLLDADQKVLNRIEFFAYRDPYIRNFVLGERLLNTVSYLLDDEAVLFKEKINFKLPGGGGFKPHQDIQPGWDDYAPYFISVLIAVDDNTEENGCLEMAGGHHKRGWIGRRFAPLEGKELDGIDFKRCPMRAGDVAIFDCFVPHQSDPNLSDRPRRNVYLTYNRKQDGDHRLQYFTDKRKSFPPDNERQPGSEYAFKV